jgi:hypothetical protein
VIIASCNRSGAPCEDERNAKWRPAPEMAGHIIDRIKRAGFNTVKDCSHEMEGWAITFFN